MLLNCDTVIVLSADDDPDDRDLLIRAVESSSIPCTVEAVSDGRALLDYLHRTSAGRGGRAAGIPDLILLDLDMPVVDGRQALRTIKVDPLLRWIPVIAFTSSMDPGDVVHAYDIGANAYVTKPSTFSDLVRACSILDEFWFKLATIPTRL